MITDTDRQKLERLLPKTVERLGLERVCDFVERFGPDGLRGLVQAEQAQKNAKKTERDNTPERPTPPQLTLSIEGQSVRLRPRMAFAAMRSKHAGAYRLWVVARMLDPRGSGVVTSERLLDKLTEHKIHDRTQKRWIADALRSGLLRQVERRSGRAYILAGEARAADLLGCERVDSRFVFMSVFSLLSDGWRSRVYAAFVDRLTIQRAKLEQVTGIPKTTQRLYERRAGVHKQKNYAVTNIQAQNIDIVHEVYDKPHAFVYQGKVSWQLPNTYLMPGCTAEHGRRGRASKTNKALRALHDTRADLSKLGQVQSVGIVRKVFYETAKTAKKAAQRLDEIDPGEVFAKLPLPLWLPRVHRQRPKLRLWEVLPTGAEYRP